MDNPRRLLDGSGTDLERRLLQELRSYRGSDDLRKRTLAALAITGSAGLSMAGALAWAKASGAKLLVGVSVASTLVAAPVAYFWSRETPIALPGATMTRRPAEPPTTPPPTTTSSSPPPPAVPPVSSPRAASADPGAPSASVAPSRAVGARAPKRAAAGVAAGAGAMTASSPLRAEVETLDAVRASLVRRDFPGALSLLDGYFRTFRHGRLQLEAEVLRIDALARAGQNEAARAQARDFLRRNPRSVHAARLQSLLEG